MKILYDSQIFSIQIYGGISRYFVELMKNYESNDEIEYKLSLKYSNNYYLKELNYLSYNTFFENYSFKGKYRLLNLFNILNNEMSKKYISKGDYDIFHPTYYDPYFLDFLNDKPFVLTIYDMIHEIFPKIFSLKDKTTEGKKLLAQKAKKIIAISENTKKDIIKFLNITESKIEVVYLGNSFNICSNYGNLNTTFPKKYLLFVGRRRWYKNFNLFIEAISTLLIEDSELYIVCAGGGKFTKFEIEKYKSLNIVNKIFYYSVNDNLLINLYKKALAFVFPSLYEGFGIPVLEAFACKCPVIVSNTSSLPEVAGDAAIYFDPTDKSSMLNSIQKVIYNDGLKKQLINKGTERVKEFTWGKTADKTKKIYEGVI